MGGAPSFFNSPKIAQVHLEEMAWIWESREQSQVIAKETDSGAGATRLAPVRADVIYSAGGQSRTLVGQLVRQHGAGLDPTTRTVACRVLIEQLTSPTDTHAKQNPLLTGMFVTVQVQCRPNRPLLKIPERGIRTDGCVWLMRSGKLEAMPVHTVQTRDGIAIVDTRSSDIDPLDRVIVSPVANARPGLAVRERDAVGQVSELSDSIDDRQVTNLPHSGGGS